MKVYKFSILISLGFIMVFRCDSDPVLPKSFYECSTSFQDSSDIHPRHSQYQQLIEDIQSRGIPGIQLAIHDEQGMWLGAAGMADIKSQIPLESCHITRVGSTVKTLTAVTILMLEEEGKLDLDDLITKYLPANRIRDIENANAATIRQLLQHSSGIFNYIQNAQFQTASLNDLKKEWTPEELLGYARGQGAYFAPGTDVRYSNTGYVFLGDIITVVEGKPFYEVFKERSFDPLDLEHTQFAAETKVPAGLIRGYVDFYSKLEVIDATYYSGWDYYTADGGLISNARDLNVFLKALFESNLISDSSLDEMTSWFAPKEYEKDFFKTDYGMGIFRMKTPWGDAYFHSGDAIGYYACMAYFPEKGTTISWATNGNYGKIDELISSQSAMEEIFSSVFDR